MTVKRYRKKTVVVEALYLYPGLITEDVRRFCPTVDEVGRSPLGIERVWAVKTLEGTKEAATGDYIIKDVAGDFFPCKPDLFALTYEEVGRPLPASERGCRQSTSGQ